MVEDNQARTMHLAEVRRFYIGRLSSHLYRIGRPSRDLECRMMSRLVRSGRFEWARESPGSVSVCSTAEVRCSWSSIGSWLIPQIVSEMGRQPHSPGSAWGQPPGSETAIAQTQRVSPWDMVGEPSLPSRAPVEFGGQCMSLKVVGAGVGRTGSNSLKLALEQLLSAPCHHMFEIRDDLMQVAVWTEAIEGRSVDLSAMLAGYSAQVDWPGASFWPELSNANPEALVLLSVRDPDAWYQSASSTILPAITDPDAPPEVKQWLAAVRTLLRDRFCDRFEDSTAMIDAFEAHNAAVRSAIPSERLLEWTPTDGWEPICERLGLDVPTVPFPHANSTAEFLGDGVSGTFLNDSE